MPPSVFVKAASTLLHPCFFPFPFAGPQLQRLALGEKPGLLTHREVSCRLASVSKHTQEWLDWNTQAISLHCLQTLARHSLIWAGETAGTFTQPTLLSHNCCTLHEPSMLSTAPLPFSASQAVKRSFKIFKTTYWGLQRRAFLFQICKLYSMCGLTLM